MLGVGEPDATEPLFEIVEGLQFRAGNLILRSANCRHGDLSAATRGSFDKGAKMRRIGSIRVKINEAVRVEYETWRWAHAV